MSIKVRRGALRRRLLQLFAANLVIVVIIVGVLAVLTAVALKITLFWSHVWGFN